MVMSHKTQQRFVIARTGAIYLGCQSPSEKLLESHFGDVYLLLISAGMQSNLIQYENTTSILGISK
jgi:hypothetical protein